MENSTWHPGQSLGNLVAADNAARSSRRSPFQDRFAESLATSHPDQSQLYVFDTVSEASWNAAAEQHPFSSLKDTQQNDHSHKLRLLSLDGGGIRGLSTLQILKTLMESVNNSAPVKPCDYFEMIGGTSTGGLIAIMLGRLHMTVDECMEAYRELSSRVFQKKNTRFNYKGKIQGQFDAHELELAVQNVLKNRGLDENTLLKDANGRCKVFVCTTAEQTGETVCLTTYRSPRMAGSDLSESTTIWQACRATTAATSFFEPIAIGQYGETFVDGAFGANNPIEQLWNEARDVWSNSFPNNVGCVVSIGTGLSRLRPVGDRLDKIWKTLEAMATETDKTAEIFHRDKADLAKGGRYYRFNVDRGLEAIGLEEYKKVREIIAATRNWTREQQNHVRIIACAHQLASSGLKEISRHDQIYQQANIVHESREPRIPGQIFDLYLNEGLPHGFTKRVIPYQQLLDSCPNGDRLSGTNIVVIHGVSGSGKTTLARYYCLENKARYWALWQIDCSTSVGIEDGFERIASCNPFIKGQQGQGAVTSSVNWLNKVQKPWLLLLDNADDKDTNFLNEAIPNSIYGTILITTTNPRCCIEKRRNPPIELDHFSDEEAAEFFWQNNLEAMSNKSYDGRNLVSPIAKKLRNHPLALKLAVESIRNNPKLKWQPLSRVLENYLDRLEKDPTEALWNDLSERMHLPPFDFLMEDMTSQQSGEEANGLLRDAIRLFRFLVFLGTGEIKLLTMFEHMLCPEQLEAGFKLLYLNDQGTECQSLSARPTLKARSDSDALLPVLPNLGKDTYEAIERVQMAAQELEKRSLITISFGCITIHPLIQECCRKLMLSNAKEGLKHALSAVNTLSLCITGGFETSSRSFRRSLVSHIDHVKKHVSVKSYWDMVWDNLSHRDAAEMLLRFSLVFFEADYMEDARSIQTQVVDRLIKVDPGFRYKITLQAHSRLAATLYDSNGPGERQDALIIRQKVRNHWTAKMQRKSITYLLHDRYLSSLADLADSYEDLPSRRQEAIEFRRETLKGREQIVIGLEQSSVALGEAELELRQARRRLARTYHSIGLRDLALQLRESEAMSVDAKLKANEQVILDEDELECLSDWAESLDAKGFWTKAMRMRKLVYRGLEESLGQGHYDTLAAAHNLSTSYMKVERFSDAVQLREQILQQLKMSRKEYHADTLDARVALDKAYAQYQTSETGGPDSTIADGWYEIAAKLQASGKPCTREILSAKAARVAYLQAVLKNSVEESREWQQNFEEARKIQHEIIEERNRFFEGHEKAEGEGEDEETILARNKLASLYSATRRSLYAYDIRKEVLQQYHSYIQRQKEEMVSRGYLGVLKDFARDCEQLTVEFSRVDNMSTSPAFTPQTRSPYMGPVRGPLSRKTRSIISNDAQIQLGLRAIDLQKQDMASLASNQNPDETRSFGGSTQEGSGYGEEDREARENYRNEAISARQEVLQYAERWSGPVPDADVLEAREDLAECLIRWEGDKESSLEQGISYLENVLRYCLETDRLGPCLVTENLKGRIGEAKRKLIDSKRLHTWLSKVEHGSFASGIDQPESAEGEHLFT